MKLVQVKSCHTFVQQSNNFKKSFNDSDKIFHSFVWKNIFDDFEKVSSITPPQTTTGTSPAVINLTNSSNSAVKVMVTDGSDEQKTTEEDSLQVSASNVATAIQAEATQGPNPSDSNISPSEETNWQQKQCLTTAISHPLNTLSKYLNITVNNIKERVFEKLNTSENTVILQGNPEISVCTSKVSNFILSTIPTITTDPLDAYNRNQKVLEAYKLAAKMLAEDEIDTSTKKVADAIASEATLESPSVG